MYLFTLLTDCDCSDSAVQNTKTKRLNWVCRPGLDSTGRYSAVAPPTSCEESLQLILGLVLAWMIKCNAGIQSYWLRVIYKIYRERERERESEGVELLESWSVIYHSCLLSLRGPGRLDSCFMFQTDFVLQRRPAQPWLTREKPSSWKLLLMPYLAVWQS